MEEWRRQGAAGLGRGIEAGRIDPRELTEAFLQAAHAHPEGSRIYAALTPQRARAEAEAAARRARLGARQGPLDGVPVSWKDLFDSAGVATEAGSAQLKGRVPQQDAEVLRQASLRGLVCLGKTQMTELAFSGLGLNPVAATPPNALDPARLPGGSSSGAAVSVALGLAPAAIGSDTGGSVRLPAVWNGLVGLKTTHGLLPTEGVVPLCPGFDTIGPICRSVEDAGLVLQALGGPKAPDLRGATLAGARLLVLETLALDDLQSQPARAFDAALGRLAAAGAGIERLALPWLAELPPLDAILYAAEAWASWGEMLERSPEQVYPPVLQRFRTGRGILAADYLRAGDRLRQLRARWREAVAGYDAVLLPTAPILPPEAAPIAADPALFLPANLLALRNTRLANSLGLCALTLPTAEPFCGVSLMALPFTEARLLRLGAAAERALG